MFGYSLSDYDELFTEKLELLLRLRDDDPVTWSGRFRAPLDQVTVHPRAEGRPLPVWIAVGGTPQSVVRAGTLGLPLALAIIGGQPASFVPLADLYRRALEYGGHDPATPLAVHAHGYVFDDEGAARAEFLPAYRRTFAAIGRERGWPRCPTRPSRRWSALRERCSRRPETVADKITKLHEQMNIDRFELHTARRA